MGLIPDDAQLVPRPESIPSFESFSKEGKEFLIHQMEINAAFMEHVDYHIGRIIKHLDDMGELDNTMVIFFHTTNPLSSPANRYIRNWFPLVKPTAT